MLETDWNEQEERAERISELKSRLSESIQAHTGGFIQAFPFEAEGDIIVHGPLSAIVEWARDWRSEIEELG
jgi:hypothetical protein